MACINVLVLSLRNQVSKKVAYCMPNSQQAYRWQPASHSQPFLLAWYLVTCFFKLKFFLSLCQMEKNKTQRRRKRKRQRQQQQQRSSWVINRHIWRELKHCWWLRHSSTLLKTNLRSEDGCGVHTLGPQPNIHTHPTLTGYHLTVSQHTKEEGLIHFIFLKLWCATDSYR